MLGKMNLHSRIYQKLALMLEILCRRYIKELENFPAKYIYEPWEAPKELQEKANCIIGKLRKVGKF